MPELKKSGADVAVFAGKYSEFKSWSSYNGAEVRGGVTSRAFNTQTNTTYWYINGVDKLAGQLFDSYSMVGTWWERSNALDFRIAIDKHMKDSLDG